MYETTTLDQFVTLQRGFDLPMQNRVDGSVPVIAASGAVGVHDEPKVMSPGVVIGRSGSIGAPQYVSVDYWPLNTTLFVKDFHGNNPKFVYYVLKTIDFKDFNAGGTVPTLNRNHLTQISVPKVAKHEQDVISDILWNIDAKIESNFNLSTLLEGMSQTIFKSWFIDFEPVKAKMAGQKPVGMDDGTAALFPDSMEDSELGQVPTGWNRTPLGEFVVARRGKVITKSKTSDGPIPVIAGGLGPAYFHNVANVSRPAITISASGANAGFVRLNLMDIWASDCSYISTTETKYVFLCFLFLKFQQENIFGMQQGGAQPHIYPSDLSRLLFSYPRNPGVLKRFEQLASVIFENVQSLEEQTKTLIEIRDSLLPRLISGELQIPEEMLAS